MQIALSNELMIALGAIVFLWLLSRLVFVPLARRAVLTAVGPAIARRGATYAVASALAGILNALMAAVVLVGIGSVALHWYLSSLPVTASVAEAVTQIRSHVEQTVDLAAGASTSVWLVCLLLLALVWVFASRSSSRKRWNAALSARRSALSAALAALSADELRERANDTDARGVEALDSRVEELIKDNDSRISDAMSKPVLQFGSDDSNVASMLDLLGISQQMQRDADELEANGGEQDRIADIRRTAGTLSEKFNEIAGEMTVELKQLDGQPVTFTLAGALTLDDDDIGLPAARETALRNLIVESQIEKHAALGTSKARAEPELVHEWLAAGATSEASVRTTSLMGRLAARTAVATVFLCAVGLGVKEVGPLVISRATALQLQITAMSGNRELAEAIEKSAPQRPARQDSGSSDLASDNATVEVLRQAFRSSVAHTLRQGIDATPDTRSAGARRLVARDHFDLGAMEARQRILAMSGRAAAPSIEPGGTGYVYASTSSTGVGTRGAATAVDDVHLHTPSFDVVDMLDDTIDRRIQVLQQNEHMWRQLRAAALRPASADIVGEAFLRTVFVQDEMVRSDALRLWTERASYDFATATARTGRPPRPGDVILPAFSEHPTLTARDRRLIADFKAEAPQRITSIIDDAHAGRVDPGSLHRALPGVNSNMVGSGPTNRYSELFPTSHAPPPASAGSDFGGGGGGVGGGGSSRASGQHASAGSTRVASSSARSFAHVRFSGRVGGVLIGVTPSPGGETLDIRDLTWRINGTALQLTLVDAAGARTVLGPFHAGIVHHALAYAADGRVVTSTLPQPMTSRSDDIQLDARRVLVHPAFEDTAFACRAIQVDRFVDSFTGMQRNLTSNEAINNVRDAVTILGRLIMIARVAPSRLAVNDNLAAVAQHAKLCGTGPDCFPVETYTRYGFNFGGTSSFLGCLKNQPRTNWEDCLQTLATTSQSTDAFWLVDSGVREGPFKLDKQLTFLTGAKASHDPLWPLDFMIQAVPQTLNGDDVAVGDEWEPWRFPRIDRAIKEQVARGVAQNPQAAAVLIDMRAFTVLQRLFRLALAGDLGMSFPLDTLVALQKETARFVKIERSERWNVNNSLIQTLMSEHEKLSQQVSSFADGTDVPASCQDAAKKALNAAANPEWPEGEGLWRSVRTVERTCRGSPGAYRMSERLELLRQHDLIDEAIDLSRRLNDDNQEFACSPL